MTNLISKYQRLTVTERRYTLKYEYFKTSNNILRILEYFSLNDYSREKL